MRAYAHGRYSEAAEAWHRAAARAESRGDRIEALYRAGASLERGRSWEKARLQFRRLAEEFPNSARAPRALYEAARAAEHLGSEPLARRELELVLERYPDSAIAPSAFERLVRKQRGESSENMVEYLTGLLHSLRTTRLEERARYALAHALLAAGRSTEARDAFVETARRFPYPTGSFWDDSLWHAATIELELHRPKAAIATLRAMLRAREPSYGQGSYERPRYAQARMRIAEIYRDALGRPEAARHEFERLWDEHPRSRLRDDAVWEAAVLAFRQGDRGDTCRLAARLVRGQPKSRYAACAPLLCRQIPSTGGRCRDSIRGRLHGKADLSGSSQPAGPEAESEPERGLR